MLELRKGLQLADRYTLVRRLGGDTSAQIWLASDRLTKAVVALKIGAGDPDSRERLRTEWQASIRLMHAHIVRVFEFHAETDVAFFSQQFIDGQDISALSGQPVHEILGPIGLLADALQYVHSKGIVHRDLKASNVLLDGNGAPYLSDFGVASPSGRIAGGGSLIAQSPQSLDKKPAAPSDDVFALGALVFELISGTSPWSAVDPGAAIRSSEMPALRCADGSDPPPAIAGLVIDMLATDAGRRPSASDVVQRLTTAGFPPATATVQRGAKPRTDDEVIESVVSQRSSPTREVRSGASHDDHASGINRTVAVVALGVLVVVLMGVIFLLPKNVADRSSPVAVSPQPAAPVDESVPRPKAADSNAESRGGVYVDPEIRKRLRGDKTVPTRILEGDEDITFSENSADYSGLDDEARARLNAESTLGELLSALEVLEGRGVERWAAREHGEASELYSSGDRAYLKKDFAYAEELYLGALTVLEPLYERIEPTFDKAYADAELAFESGDRLDALRLYELAVAITPTHADARAGYERAKNLETVLQLIDQGLDYEKDLDLEAAQRSFEQAVSLDKLWEPAHEGIRRVQQKRTEIEFDSRMSEGFQAIAAGDYLGARAAFRVAQQLMPGSSEPADGLLQVDQGLRLRDIVTLEQEALSLQEDEHWEAVVTTYEEILKVDSTLSFAREGLANAREMSALHARLDELIAKPDRLSIPSVMQEATKQVVSVTTRPDIGPRLAGQRDELSRLLKRAATPLTVPLVSDNVTNVSIYKVGKLGNFMRTEVRLRPGTYVAVGSRPGFRDVRLEFRVAPEIDIEPVVVQCEEQI